MQFSFTQRATILDSDLETPVGLFLRLAGDLPGILLESAEVDGRWGRYSVIGTDFLISASCREGLLELRAADERLVPLRDLAGRPFIQGLRQLLASLRIHGIPTQPPITRALYGWLGYGMASLFDPQNTPFLPPPEAEASLALPGSLIIFDHGYNRITRLDLLLDNEQPQALPPPPPAAAPQEAFSPLADQDRYVEAVSRIKKLIHQGEATQVTLSAPFSAPLSEKPFNLYRHLRRLSPSPYMFYMRLPDMRAEVLLGASPEVLVSCQDGRLCLCPVGGAGPHYAENILFEDEPQDPKQRNEHALLVELGRRDLERIARPGSVRLERFMEVEHFSHTLLLTSRIQADLAPGRDALDTLAATFPAGTVSGIPRLRAMEIIAAEERAPRGPYAGAIGWIGLDQEAVHLDFGITLRSLWVRGGRVCWQTGAAVTHDSTPEKNWAECRAEAEIIAQATLDRETPKTLPPERMGAGEPGRQAPSSPNEGRPSTPKNLNLTDGPVQMSAIMEHLARRRNLSPEEATAAFSRLMDGELSHSQAGALLLGLRAKGETPDEVAAAVNAVLARAVPIPSVSGPAIDIVGTGGDGKHSFNCSTATALTLAGMGYKVLKHGNRSISSSCGSADVLEQLGLPLDIPPEAVAETLEREGFVFFFAPLYHPSFLHVMPVRRELGMRTLFNILGPLVNPARPTHRFLGVADQTQLSLVAAALARLEPEAGVVVHGAGNYDEITPLGEASMIFVHGLECRPGRLNPAEYGIAPCTEQDLTVDGPEHAAEVLREALSGQGSRAVSDMLALNLGLALYLFGSGKQPGEALDPTCGYNRQRMRETMAQAKEAVAAGAGRRFCRA
ncbi:MAG: anthranilate phosphoribosyltransferase [Desulfovibrionaceae bacterium]|nr:anthranilate phosphoribosyltransferase [Desulfovibrionaceae bacterium]